MSHVRLATHGGGLTVGIALGHAVTATSAAATVIAKATSTAAASSGAVVVALSRGTVTESGDVRGGPLLLDVVELLVEANGLTVVQGLETILHDVGVVDEDVFRPIVGGDEPETLVAKKLHFPVERHIDENFVTATTTTTITDNTE